MEVLVEVDWQTIFGVQLGFEILDDEGLQDLGLDFGMSIDLFIVRIVILKFKD